MGRIWCSGLQTLPKQLKLIAYFDIFANGEPLAEAEKWGRGAKIMGGLTQVR